MANLKQTMALHGLELPEDQRTKVKHYCQVLWALNKSLNLTRHTTYDKFVTRDLFDAIQLAELIPEGQDVLDIGSGGGVPGVLLAIIRPDLRVTLSESVGKKALALGQITEGIEVELDVYHCRGEDLLADFRFDYTTARAVGPLAKLGTWFADVWPSVGTLLALKGPNWPNEKAAADEENLFENVSVEVASQYHPPGAEWQSYILAIKSKKYKPKKP